MSEIEKVANTVASAAQKVVNVADKVVARGKNIVNIAALMRRHEKAQQQLGALVYSLSKRGEENTLLVNRYIEAIEKIELKIKEQGAVIAIINNVLECPHCRQKLPKNAVFCRECGERLQ